MEIQQLKAAEVVRNKYGFWNHPEWENYFKSNFNQNEHLSDEEITRVHVHFNVMTDRVYFEFDAPEELTSRYYKKEDQAAIIEWNPSKPDHDRDWFLVSIFENSNGDVVALWAKQYNTFLSIERPLFEENFVENGEDLDDLVWEGCTDGNGSYQPNWSECEFEHGEDEEVIFKAKQITSKLNTWLECARLKNLQIDILKAELAKAKEASL
ncbi:TPA: hypothetical protein OTT47_000278 [Acinetobacter nosocomialis]|uniref:hypothetical protein n=1 Tax=Acinetobacter nosocomialis TaxID=106654 RepID=UPI000DE79838|nr:hypothetical protein [Acinetobacter nosocomialis]SSR60863.1 Uncharacterised protein [Acinetobacter nosocomialis]HCT3318138.1 hypothetical protein [Acinetobacter nosocomialis]